MQPRTVLSPLLRPQTASTLKPGPICGLVHACMHAWAICKGTLVACHTHKVTCAQRASTLPPAPNPHCQDAPRMGARCTAAHTPPHPHTASPCASVAPPPPSPPVPPPPPPFAALPRPTPPTATLRYCRVRRALLAWRSLPRPLTVKLPGGQHEHVAELLCCYDPPQHGQALVVQVVPCAGD